MGCLKENPIRSENQSIDHTRLVEASSRRNVGYRHRDLPRQTSRPLARRRERRAAVWRRVYLLRSNEPDRPELSEVGA